MIRVYINDEEVTFNKNIQIKEEILATSSTILDNCYPISWEDDKDYVSRFYLPKDYSRCEFYDNDELIFAGVIKNTGNITLNPRYPKYCKLQVLDFKTFLSEGMTLDFVIANKTVKEAIEQVTKAISSYGFVIGNIILKNADDVIGAYSTLDQTAYDVYQYFSEITGSKWYTRRIDKKTIAVDFYDPEALPRAKDIEYTNEYFEDNNILDDICVSYSTSDYRNKQVIKSSKIYANINSIEQKIADGYNTEFSTEKLIGRINSITVNGEEKTFALEDAKKIGITADFYYNPSESKFISSTTYISGTVINVNYIAIINGREIAYSISEISRIKEQLGINGTISRYEDRNDILYSEQLNNIAKSYIKYKGKADISLTISTTNKDLFFIGQQVYFKAPIDMLKTDYMVKEKNISIYIVGSEKYVFYTFKLSSNYNSESAINFFDNQRRKANGNISQGEYISRNIDLENTANIIFSDLQVEEIDISTGNILDGSLDMPL